MAKLNFEFYTGTDFYSDGDVEELIYDIVKNQKDYRKMELNEQEFAVSYHLSPTRQNILNWYPFERDCTVLEIGSGCGALTGMLCERCQTVVSVELSKRRSNINYMRNQKHDNLEIIIGNVSEIRLDRKFEYVILNGVFEYAASFINSSRPYHDLLQILSNFLQPEGKILLAIENRLGIKYFAGEVEDHTNKYFLGLNGYYGENGVRTFSRGELSNIIKECGFSKYRFYYPYPDYKFPMEIFCDESINAWEYGKRCMEDFGKSIEVFNVFKMMKTLREEEVMQNFANSFLVEIGWETCRLSSIFYTKISSKRRDRFKIATIIKDEQEGRVVEKKPLTRQAVRHIEQLEKNQNTILPENFIYLKGILLGDCIKFPYVKYENMDKVIRDLLSKKKIWEVKRLIHSVYESFEKISEEKKDIYTDKFVELFGNERSDSGFKCIYNCNIDLICDNIYLTNEGYMVIDAEWVAECWIPIDFIIWRMLNEMFVKHEELFSSISREDFYMEFEIWQSLNILFRKWANHFADNYVSDIFRHNDMPPVQKLDLNEIVSKEFRKNEFSSNLYINQGKGFSEENKIAGRMDLFQGIFQVTFNIRGIKGVKQMRWDPLENVCCRCIVNKCVLSGRNVRIEPCNSVPEDKTLFMNADPQFNIYGIMDSDESLLIEGTLEVLDTDEIVDYFRKKEQELERLRKENIILRELMVTLESEVR